MSDQILGALVVGLPLVFLIGGVIIVIAGMIFKARMLDLQHRERLAMIERGLAPPPEISPTGSVAGRAAPSSRTSRAQSIGVIVIGVGFAFMCLIGIAAGAPQEAIGIGGAIVILGTAFIVRSMLVQAAPSTDSDSRLSPVPPPPPPVPPREP
jgi:hypothetical protein